MNKNRSDEFVNPPSKYRGKPFWAWNGKLEKSELIRQLDVMKEMGFGGAFMHSRTGLVTEYLSKEWFELINACAEHCKKNAMEAWLYDEDRWPSGAAGGLVTKNEKYRMRSLKIHVCDKNVYLPDKDHLAIFVAEINNDGLSFYRRISAKEAKKAVESKIIYCSVKLQEPSSWYNGQTYLDTMSEEAVEKFLQVTHKQYKKNSGKYFGEVIPGIFTDEPNYGNFRSEGNSFSIPWTEKIPSIFRKKYGYDLLDYIPEIILTLNNEKFSKVRHDYFETITSLFVTAFGKKIYDYCEKVGLIYTGHVLSEESLRSQLNVVGSAMRFYEYMQAPGIDILCAQGLEREGGAEPEFLTAKQCVSVLNQTGRKWMLSELYGCTGWHFTFAEHKAVGDWQAAMGVNLRCQHLSWYTMRGEAKRDYPASIFFQSPFWKDYNLVEDYFARLSYKLSEGRPLIKLGVIHPAESAWSVAYMKYGEKTSRGGFTNDSISELDQKLSSLQKILLQNHYDFEYIDEDILSRLGKVSKNRLEVGKSSYSSIIVPPLKTLRKSTAEALAKFAKNGGNLIFIESFPQRIDCEPQDTSSTFAKFAKITNVSEKELLENLSSDKSLRRVSVKSKNGEEFKKSLYMLRKNEKLEFILFVCSTFQNGDEEDVEVIVPCAGQVQEWDAHKGKIYLADYEENKDCVKIKTSLFPYGSRLFVISPHTDAKLSKKPRFEIKRTIEIEANEFKILRDEPNAFPLDFANFAIGENRSEKPEEILKIDTLVREKAGWGRQGGNMVQPWANKEKDTKTIPVSLEYKFIVNTILSAPLFIAIETPERFQIKLNNFPIKHDGGEGWWIDNSFKKINIPAHYLKKGENSLCLSIDYGKEDALETIYLAGEFSAKWQDNNDASAPLAVLDRIPETLKIGDWCEQGFPCYGGAICYHTEIENINFENDEKIFLKIPDWAGSLLKIYVNGKLHGRIAWQPYEIEITDALAAGKNTIGIEVVSTRKNLLGPLHNKNKYLRWTGPWDFRREEDWTNHYARIPYGLLKKPLIVVKK